MHATDGGVLVRLSAGTEAALVHWNDFADNRLAYAVDGRVVTSFDFSREGSGRKPGREEPAALDGLDFGAGEDRAKAMVFLERVAGQRIASDWLQDEHPGSVIVPPDRFEAADPLPSLLPGVDDNGGEAFRVAADLAVARVTPEGEVADPLEAARQSFREGAAHDWEDPEEDDDEPTGGSIDDYFAEQQAAEDALAAAEAAKRRAHGWAAVHGRLREDPREALRAVLTQARQADPEGWPQLQRDVIAVLSA